MHNCGKENFENQIFVNNLLILINIFLCDILVLNKNGVIYRCVNVHNL